MTAYAGAFLSLHEFAESCGLSGWWIEIGEECGSICISEQDGIRMGYLELAPVSDIGENQNHVPGQG